MTLKGRKILKLAVVMPPSLVGSGAGQEALEDQQS